MPPFADVPPEMRWLPGERDAWAARSVPLENEPEDPGTWVDATHTYLSARQQAGLIARAPDSIARPLLTSWRPGGAAAIKLIAEQPAKLHSYRSHGFRGLGDDQLRAIAARFEVAAAGLVLHAVRLDDEQLPVLLPFFTAEIAALMAVWLKKPKHARPVAAQWLARHATAAALALTPAAVGPRGAGRSSAQEALTVITAAGHGDAVLAAAAHCDPAAAAKVRNLIETTAADGAEPPAWVNVDLLPTVLSEPQTRRIVALLATSAPNAELQRLTAAAGRRAVAELVWAVAEQHRASGSRSFEGWVYDALGRFGDDDTAAAIGTMLRGRRTTLDIEDRMLGALVAIGTPASLTQLCDLAWQLRQPTVAEAALERIAELARAARTEVETFADRHAPADDHDPAMVVTQARRFENAMIEQRRWTGAAFTADVLGNPLLRAMAAGLVWMSDGEAFTAGTSDVATDAVVTLAHPVLLGPEEVRGWTATIGTAAPFAQLTRPTVTLPEAERRAGALRERMPRRARAGQIRELLLRGWRATRDVGDDGPYGVHRMLAGGNRCEVRLHRGYSRPTTAAWPIQWVTVILNLDPARTLDPVSASELLADMALISADESSAGPVAADGP